MSSTPPLNIRETNVADYIDLTTLSLELQAIPEPLYLWPNYVSTKQGPKQPGKGSKVQVDRLKPLESPDPDNLAAYLAGTGAQATSIASGNLQSLNWSKVTIQVRRHRMPKPVAEKFETQQLSQIDLMMAHRINIRRNYHEFLDDLCRETYRAAVSSNIFGKSLASTITAMSNDPAVDGLSVGMLKEYKRRAGLLNLRAFGSVPGSDMQALAGFYNAITDQHGINEITEDELWRDYIKRHQQEKDKLIKGYFGEYEQISLVKSDRMRIVDVGPTGAPYDGHEIIFMASDPILIDPGEDGVQGFVGEAPVILAMIGLPEVKQASETNFGEDLIFTWFHTLGTQSGEELTAGDAATLATLLGASVGTGKSRFIHRGYFV